MLPLLSVVLLSATSAAPDTQLTIAGTELSRVRVEQDVADYALEHLSQRLATEGIHLVTPKEIGTLLGMEKQRQLLGCSEGSSNCMVELGNALGAAGVLVGDLAHFGEGYQLNLRVLDTQTGKPVVTSSQQAKSDAELPQAFDAAAAELVRGLRTWAGNNGANTATATNATGATNGNATAANANASGTNATGTNTDGTSATGTGATTGGNDVTATPGPRFSRTAAYVPAGIAAAGLIVAGAGFGYAAYAHNELNAAPTGSNAIAIGDDQALADRGNAMQWAARIGGGVAVAAGATAAVLWFLGAPPEKAPAVSLAITPDVQGRTSVFLSGTFP